MEKNYPIVEKGWEINMRKLKSWWESDSICCSAPTINKAKKMLLDKVRYDEWKLDSTDEELTYLNIPVIRCPGADKILFEDRVIIRSQLEDILQKRERYAELDRILDSPDIKYCYIYKRGYYCPGWGGYTDYKWQAGVYTKEEAVQHARGVREISLEPINIEEHNKKILEKIADLQSRLINVLN